MTGRAASAAFRRDRAIVIAAIIAISMLAWGHTLWLAAHMSMMEMPGAAAGSGSTAATSTPHVGMPGASGAMPEMHAGAMSTAAEPAFRPWRFSDFAFMFVMWAVMMVGMMTPSVTPMVLLYAAVGRNADWYLGRWRAMAAAETNRSWNWAACLFGPFWFAWRRMWLPAAIVAIAFVILTLVSTAGDTLGRLSTFGMIAVGFVTGLIGNHVYRLHVKRRVKAAGAEGAELALETLRKNGGTSSMALVAAILIATAGVIVMSQAGWRAVR